MSAEFRYFKVKSSRAEGDETVVLSSHMKVVRQNGALPPPRG